MSAVHRVRAAVSWVWNHSIGWVLQITLLGLIRGYQVAISPLLPPSCRYHPSCSAYAFGAIRDHGALKGVGLAGWRLLRCNPWSGGGLDPVPRRGQWRPDILPNGEPRFVRDPHADVTVSDDRARQLGPAERT